MFTLKQPRVSTDWKWPKPQSTGQRSIAVRVLSTCIRLRTWVSSSNRILAVKRCAETKCWRSWKKYNIKTILVMKLWRDCSSNWWVFKGQIILVKWSSKHRIWEIIIIKIKRIRIGSRKRLLIWSKVVCLKIKHWVIKMILGLCSRLLLKLSITTVRWKKK